MEQDVNNYKRDNIKLIVIFSSVLLVLLSFFYILTARKIDKIENKSEESIQVFDEVSQETAVYKIKEYNGKIGIFENDALIYTLDVYLFTLPEKDKKLLSEGIQVSSKEELYEIIEEYY